MQIKNSKKISSVRGFGINVELHLHDSQSLQKVVRTLKELRVDWIRLDIGRKKYTDIQVLNRLKHFCELCAKEDIVIVGLLSEFVPGTIMNIFFPHWAHSPIIHDRQYNDFVKYLASQLRSYVFHWEIWNEQNSKRFWINNPNPKEYVSFLKEISRVIKSEIPDAQCIFGGITGNDITPQIRLPKSLFHFKDFINESLKYDALKHVEYFAFHPYVFSCYFSFKGIAEIIKEIEEAIDETVSRYKHIPLMITEIGVSPVLNRKLTYKSIAEGYKTLISYCKKKDIPVCIYTLIDPHPKHYGWLNPDRDFGILDSNLNHKQLYHELIKL